MTCCILSMFKKKTTFNYSRIYFDMVFTVGIKSNYASGFSVTKNAFVNIQRT